MSSLPSVTISLVNWNGLSHTRECVRHCLELDYPNFELVIVDNGSSDGSFEALTAEYGSHPRISVLGTERNLGFARANNVVLARALRRGSDFIWLLNNDTKVNPNTLRALVEAALNHPRAGIFGSKIFFWDRPDTIWYAGGIVQRHGHHSGIHRGEGEIDTGQYQAEEEVEFITGCSLLIRAATVRDIHFISDQYFVYWEDVDWCTRAWQAGWACLYVPRSTLLHRVGASSGKMPELKCRYDTRNRLLYQWRFNKPRAVEIMLSIVNFALESVQKGNIEAARPLVAGACDFLLGRKGKLDT